MKNLIVTVNGVAYNVTVEEGTGAPVAAAAPVAAPAAAPAPAGGVQVCAPMPGKILRVLVNKGDAVKRGDNLMILEAMKMENEIPCDCDGTVLEAVNSGDLLAVIG